MYSTHAHNFKEFAGFGAMGHKPMYDFDNLCEVFDFWDVNKTREMFHLSFIQQFYLICETFSMLAYSK